MARLEIRIKSYDLAADAVLSILSSIEREVEILRPSLLTAITKELLQAEQTRHEKKVDLSSARFEPLSLRP